MQPQTQSETWLNKPRPFLWKLGASFIWIVIWFSILLGTALLTDPGRGADETQAKGWKEMMMGIFGITTIAIPAGIFFLFKLPKPKK